VIRDGIRRAFNLALRRRDRWEREVEEEIKLHVALRVEQLMAEGTSADEAYSEAIRRFGPLDDSRERLLDAARHRESRMQRVEVFDDLRSDLSFALRTFERQKGWTAVAVITLALGIGAATAVFSAASRLLLHPLPYPDADRVVFVDLRERSARATGTVRLSSPPPLVRFWQTHDRALETIQAYHTGPAMLKTTGEPSQLSGAWIAADFPTFAGQRPVRGRMFTSDEQRTHAHVVLLAEDLWRTRFGANDHAIGRAVTLDDSLYVIIGVLPSGLHMPLSASGDPDVWLPLDAENNRVGVELIGRLRRDVPLAAAERELDSLALRSGVFAANPPFVAQLVSPSRAVAFHDSLAMLCGAVAIVLLVACANVAHLLLARGVARRREFAVRAALGARRGRLVRQLITESLVLSTAGCITGVVIGQAALRVMIALRPATLWELDSVRLDATTLIAAAIAGTVCGVVFGVLGALQATRPASESLHAGSLPDSHSARGDRLRSVLIVSEMALSATLVVGAVLLVRSVINLQRTDVGFEPSGLYSVDLFMSRTRYPTEASRGALLAKVKSGLRAIPGVREVVATTLGPYSRTSQIGALEVEGEKAPDASAQGFVDVDAVETGYFRTMGIPFVEGRTFSDTSKQSREVVINAGFARKHWKPGSAVGRRVRIVFGGKPVDEWMQVVGVVADAMLTGPAAETSAPLLYLPWNDVSQPAVMIRTDSVLDPVVPVRAVIRAIDPVMQPVFVGSMRQIVASSLAKPRFIMLLLTGFTLIAVALAAIGLYGMTAYSVARRTREIGIRVALGATHGAIARAILLRGAGLSLVGAVVGLTGAYWTTRFLSTLLYGVTPIDVVSYASGAAVLIGAALLACVVPARRALAIDPMTAIRAE
jgi:predicted permease